MTATRSLDSPARNPHILLIKPVDGGERHLFAVAEARAVAVSWEETMQGARRRIAVQRFDAVFVSPEFPAKALRKLCERLERKDTTPVFPLRNGGAHTGTTAETARRRTEDRARDFAAQIVSVLAMRKLLPSEEAPQPERRFSFGPFRLNDATREIMRRDGAAISLTTAEFELLTALIANPKNVLSRGHLSRMTGIQGPGLSDRNIDVLICRLRRKIELDPREPRYIKTVRDRGYLFATAVEVAS